MVEIKGGDMMLKRLAAMVKKNRGAVLSVGYLHGSTEADGTPIPLVAALNEFGSTRKVVDEKGKEGRTEHVPPRPFMRATVQRKKGDWGKNLGTALKVKGYDLKEALKVVGNFMVGDFKQTINEFTTPANAPSTIASKGYDAPLRASKNMLNATDYRID